MANFIEQRGNPSNFYDYTRMSVKTFDYILDAENSDLESDPSNGSILGLPTKRKTLTMKSPSCFCNSGSGEHYKIDSIEFALKPRSTAEEVYTEFEPEDLESAEPKLKATPNKSP